MATATKRKSKFDVEDEKLSLRTFDPLNVWDLLLWGPPGGGKTVLAHTFPRTRTLNVDDDRGDSIIWAMREGIIPQDTEFVRATITERMNEDERGKYGFVKKPRAMDRVTDKIDSWLEDEDEWDTLVVDSATSLNLYMLLKGTEGYGLIGRSESWTQSKRIEALSPRIQDYMPAKSYFLQFVQWIRSLGKFVVLVAHEYTEENEGGYVTARYPFLIGSLRQEVPKEFGEVWYLERHVDKQGVSNTTAYTAPDRTVKVCKSRMGFLPPKMENPTFPKIAHARDLYYKGDTAGAMEALKAEPTKIQL